MQAKIKKKNNTPLQSKEKIICTYCPYTSIFNDFTRCSKRQGRNGDFGLSAYDAQIRMPVGKISAMY